MKQNRLTLIFFIKFSPQVERATEKLPLFTYNFKSFELYFWGLGVLQLTLHLCVLPFMDSKPLTANF